MDNRISALLPLSGQPAEVSDAINPKARMLLLAGVLGVLAIVTMAYGFAFRVSAEGMASYYRVWSWLFVACLVLLAAGVARGRMPALAESSVPEWLAPVFTGITLLSSLYFSLEDKAAVLAAALFVVALTGMLCWRRQFRLSLISLLGVNFLLCCYLVWHTPIVREAADMLPEIGRASLMFLHGRSPYADQHFYDFGYLPAQWLVYFPMFALGLDPRIVNLCCLLAASVLAIRLVDHRRLDRIVFVALCPLLVSRTAIVMTVQGEVWPQWLMVLGFASAFISGHRVLAYVLLGIAMATRQTEILIFAGLGAFMMFRARFPESVKTAAIVLAVYASIILPWAAVTPNFLPHYYIEFQRFAQQLHAATPEMDWSQVSLLNLLLAFDLQAVRPILQLFGLFCGLLFLLLGKRIGPAMFLCIIGLMYLWGLSLNVMVFRHYYYPGLFLIIMGLSIPVPLVHTFRAR
jgi:hypothetical protein